MKKIIIFFVKWLIIFFVASILIFAAVRMMPSTPVDKWLDAYHLPHTEENVRFMTEKMGLDDPAVVQYGKWIGNFVRGDWGVSLVSGENIRERFFDKMPYSFSIGIFGLLIGASVAFLLGYRAALTNGGICDKLTTFMTIFSQSVPMFIISILIINAFGVKLKIASFFTGNGYYSIMAAIVITALYCIGGLSRVVRSAFRGEMGKSYVKFMVSRGFDRKIVLRKHAYKPALSSLISSVITRFAGVFGGSTVLEFAFTIPGVSYFLVDSMQSSDYTVLQTYLLVVVIWMFCVHAVLNLVLYALDVRRRA